MKDPNKIRDGEWIPGRVQRVNGDQSMIWCEIQGQCLPTNKSKLRKNPCPWHDVCIPGLDRAVPEVPEMDASILPADETSEQKGKEGQWNKRLRSGNLEIVEEPLEEEEEFLSFLFLVVFF